MIASIISWNVNGLRAIINKGALKSVFDLSPDILCLQEIKARPEQITAVQSKIFDGYSCIWHPAERLGYSGVATFSRLETNNSLLGLGDIRFDCEGRAIVSQYPEFLLVNAYFPSGQRDYGRVTYKLEFYEHLLALCDAWHSAGQNIIICGDFNTAHNEIDLKNPRQNQKTSGFLPEEREWIDRYLAHGFADAYRTLYPERIQYTWWTYTSFARERQVGWRLDNFMVSSNLMSRVRDVVIHDEITGSDHCPVSILLNVS
jgi:exodeoxyribonuclease III